MTRRYRREQIHGKIMVMENMVSGRKTICKRKGLETFPFFLLFPSRGWGSVPFKFSVCHDFCAPRPKRNMAGRQSDFLDSIRHKTCPNSALIKTMHGGEKKRSHVVKN